MKKRKNNDSNVANNVNNEHNTKYMYNIYVLSIRTFETGKRKRAHICTQKVGVRYNSIDRSLNKGDDANNICFMIKLI